MSIGIVRKAVEVGATILLAYSYVLSAVAEPRLPAPYEKWTSEEIAATAFGILAGQRDVWLNDVKLWDTGSEKLLAVIAEAERPNVDGSFCDCARPTRLALIAQDEGELDTIAATLISEVREGITVSLTSPLIDRSLIDGGEFRLNRGTPLLPVVREWNAGNRPRAELTLYRRGDWQLVPVFTRLILDDPTEGNPDLSGMRARIKMGDLDPGGIPGFADIRFVEHYFTRFGDDIVALDDRRIEIWVFGGDRYSLVQCELYGPMGFGACVQ